MPEKPKMASWLAAVVTALGSTLALLVFDLGIQALTRPTRTVVAHSLQAMIIVGACALICRREPRSGWYVVPIANAYGLVIAVTDANFWRGPLWIAVVLGWLASAGVAVWAAKKTPSE